MKTYTEEEVVILIHKTATEFTGKEEPHNDAEAIKSYKDLNKWIGKMLNKTNMKIKLSEEQELEIKKKFYNQAVKQILHDVNDYLKPSTKKDWEKFIHGEYALTKKQVKEKMGSGHMYCNADSLKHAIKLHLIRD